MAVENARADVVGQCCPPSTTTAPSLLPVLPAALDLPSKSSSSEGQAIINAGDSNYDGYDYHMDTDLSLELTTGDFLDSPGISHIQDSISVDYMTLAPMEAELFMNIDNIVHNQELENSFEGIEQQPLTMVHQSTPLSTPLSNSSQLEQGLEGLLDDSKISSIVDSMINSPLQDRCLSCVTVLRDRCCHSTVHDGSDDDEKCRCHAMLNKIFLIVMDPKLSQPSKLLPLDLILFLEQTLQNTVETIKHCTVCGSSALSSANGITLCIAANWIANNIQAALESEINMLTGSKPSNSLWSNPGRRPVNIDAAKEQCYGKSTNSSAVPPSLDARNSLHIGTWSASNAAWALCVSVILTKRIRRMQDMLSIVDADTMEVAEIRNHTTTAKAKHEMAKSIRTKADLLLGMVETWVYECQPRC